MNLNNPPNAIQGAKLKGMGLVAGVADMTYLMPNAALVFIEFKTEEKTSKQSKAQIEWANLVRSLGFRYEIVRTFNDFQILITSCNTTTIAPFAPNL